MMALYPFSLCLSVTVVSSNDTHFSPDTMHLQNMMLLPTPGVGVAFVVLLKVNGVAKLRTPFEGTRYLICLASCDIPARCFTSQKCLSIDT